MKANELMIGDWVQDRSGAKMKIMNIEYHCTRVLHNGEELILSCFEQANLMPIPLTPKILEKNLATEPQISWCVGWNKKDDIHVEINREDLNASFYGVIDFVHQLQHALRLCGIDKNIVL